MGRISMCCLLLLPVVIMYEQNQFTIKFERMELVQFDNTHVDYAMYKTFKYNRTQTCVNGTFKAKTAFENNLQMEVQAYRFASNEYREFPLRFSFDFCQSANKNDFGLGDVFKCGEIPGCPLKKGVNHFCNWFPNARRFPPYIPSGSYMVDVKHFYRSVEVIFVRAYGIVSYPLV